METPTGDAAKPNEAPLLPNVLLGPVSFLWLWVLPLAVLGAINLHGYWLIGSEMSPEQRRSALWLGGAGLANLIAGLAVFCLAKLRRPGASAPAVTHPTWGLPGLLVQIAYLWLAIASLADGLLPRNVMAWIYPEQRFVFNQFTFCMLPAFHGILRLVAGHISLSLGRTLLISLGAGIGGPVLLYVAGQIFIAAGAPHKYAWVAYFFATLLITTGVLMFCGVLRALLVILRNAQSWHETGERSAVVVLALVLPLAGLTLNITIPFPVDFQAAEVYLLTVANALVVLFAVWTGETRPRLRWHLLWATFPFSLYFFIVFLPFTPLSVLAVIAMGAGFLVLTPILLFALHLHLLAKAWRQVSDRASRRRLLLGGALAVLILPAFFTGRAIADKAALNAALDHVYEPTVPGGDIAFDSSLTNLRRALDSHRSYKEGIYYPLLSDYYAWLVFNNLVLPDDKLKALETTFFASKNDGSTLDPMRRAAGDPERSQISNRKRILRGLPPPRTVEIAKIQTRVAAAETHRSVVTLSLELRNTGQAAAEYETPLALPAGVFVRGFRLQVGETLVPGRLFEKKTALWVYSMIRDLENRDPGVLYYRTPSELELRVFPVLAGKPVTVEMDFLVPAGVSATQLAESAATPHEVLQGIARQIQPGSAQGPAGDRVIVGLDALPLPVMDRESYLHVIVDRSREHGFTGDLAAAWPDLRKKFPGVKHVRVTMANYEVTTLIPEVTAIERTPAIHAVDLDRLMPLSGGLAIDLALAHAIRLHRDRDLDGARAAAGPPPRPIFVILSRHAADRAMNLPLTEAWRDLVPGLELHEMGVDGTSVVHIRDSRLAGPLLRVGASVRPLMNGRLPRFASADPKAEAQIWKGGRWEQLAGVPTQAADPGWSGAVELQLRQQDHDRNPGGSGLTRRSLVEDSRKSGVLLASTSYIVVENQAQWKMLELGERQKLGQNQALEFVETPAPPALWAILGFGGWLLLRRQWRKRRGPLCSDC
jgi:hypothetical protein